MVTRHKLRELGGVIPIHPSHSTDYAASDYYMCHFGLIDLLADLI